MINFIRQILQYLRQESQYLRKGIVLTKIGIPILILIGLTAITLLILSQSGVPNLGQSSTSTQSVISDETMPSPTQEISVPTATKAQIAASTVIPIVTKLTPTQVPILDPTKTPEQITISPTLKSTIPNVTSTSTPEQCFVTNYGDSVMRNQPGTEGTTIKSQLEREKMLIRLGESQEDDQGVYIWQNVRDPETGEEGWVAEKRIDDSQVLLSIDSNCDGNSDN